jgi:hypothetical protein
LPIENQSVGFLDEIEVKASITDNEIIRSVQLSLISVESKNRVLRTESFQPNSTTFELSEVYEISDSLLAGGEYYFRVEAKDDDNTLPLSDSLTLTVFPREKLVVLFLVLTSTTQLFTKTTMTSYFKKYSTFPVHIFLLNLIAMINTIGISLQKEINSKRLI